MIDPSIPLGIKPPAPQESPLALYGQVLGIQNAQQNQQANAQKLQMGDVELKQQQRNLDAEDALNKGLQKYTSVDPATGSFKIDQAGLVTHLTNSGYGKKAMEVDASLREAGNKAVQAQLEKLKLAGEQNGQIANIASSIGTVDQNEADPIKKAQSVAGFNARANNAVDLAQQRGLPVPPQILAMRQQPGGIQWSPELETQINGIAQSATTWQQHHEAVHQDLQDVQANLNGESTRNKNEAETAAANEALASKQKSDAVVALSQATSPGDYDAKLSKVDPKIAAQLPASKDLDFTNPEAARAQILRSGMTADQVAADERTKKLSDDTMLLLRSQGELTGNTYMDKITPAAAKAEMVRRKPPSTVLTFGAAGQITPDDIKREGEIFARTGTMPNLGMGSKEVKTAVMHAGDDWARSNNLSPSEVVTMRAAYSGDKASLAKFQANRDNIASFEKTAGKNLDQFLSLAGKIPDTGIPWLNTPIRELDQKLVGAENMAAVNAARAVATNEIAKVTAGGGLSSVLSDAARKEVKDYNPANATFAQTKAVAKVLKQDMENRRTSMDETLSDIRSRIGGGGGTGGSTDNNAPKATKRFNPKTGQIESVTQ